MSAQKKFGYEHKHYRLSTLFLAGYDCKILIIITCHCCFSGILMYWLNFKVLVELVEFIKYFSSTLGNEVLHQRA